MGICIQTPNDDDDDNNNNNNKNCNDEDNIIQEHEMTMANSTMDIEWERGDKKTNSNCGNVGREDDGDDEDKGQQQQNIVTVTVPHHILDALTAVTEQIHQMVPRRYKPYVTMDNLISVQPNHHNGAQYLPAHLDFPRVDGFGIVIATIGISDVNGSQIVLIDDGDENEDTMSWSFPLEDGECYVLSGNARNKCLHGVLCPRGQRATLNLRYGLHSAEFAYDEVERHWP